MGQPAQRHIAALDGVRGLALILVIVAHANLYFGGPFANGPVSGPLAAVLGYS